MKILVLADEECKVYWDFFKKEYFEGIDLIVSCGDLNARYLSFLTTLTAIPVLYVRGNHDTGYLTEGGDPDGCICIEDKVYVFQGVRFAGLGGCFRYNNGPIQYTERQMRKRARRLILPILFHGGVDVLVTHAPARGVNDSSDMCHRGFQTFVDFIHRYKPIYFVHGHVHMSYGHNIPREDHIGTTTVINAYEKYIIEI